MNISKNSRLWLKIKLIKKIKILRQSKGENTNQELSLIIVKGTESNNSSKCLKVLSKMELHRERIENW